MMITILKEVICNQVTGYITCKRGREPGKILCLASAQLRQLLLANVLSVVLVKITRTKSPEAKQWKPASQS